MALLFFDGFDAGDYLTKYQSVGTGPSLSAATRYGTGQCLTFATAAQEVRKDVTAAAKLLVGVAFKSASFSDTLDLLALAGDAGVRPHVTVRVLASGAVALYRVTGNLLATSAAGVCAPGQWHYLEVSATVSDTVGVVTARIDGAQVVTFTGDTKNAGTNATLDRVTVQTLTTTGGTFLDDLYIADGTGPAPRNDFLGEVRVQTLRPNGPGNSTGLTPVGSGTNWQNVDETPPSATDYNWSGVAGTRDLYTLEDLAAGTTTVYGVQTVTYAQKTDAATRSAAAVIRTAGANYTAASRALTTTATAGFTVSNVHPAAGAEWTVADVNALEAGIEVA
jgi:hypothetical protein